MFEWTITEHDFKFYLVVFDENDKVVDFGTFDTRGDAEKYVMEFYA